MLSKRVIRFAISGIALGGFTIAPLLAVAQDAPAVPEPESVSIENTVVVPAHNQDQCIAQMATFPTDDALVRYQFFKLMQDTAYGADGPMQALLDHYGQPAIPQDTPVLEVIEDVANPVLRQAAPEIIVSSMNHMIGFAVDCEVFISGQMESLQAFDATLLNPEFNAVITEDALYLRQILTESLDGVGATEDTQWSWVAETYSTSLIAQRDALEFAAFETDIAELETLFMNDLDGRLKRSNDTINAEMDREILGDSVRISNDLNEAARQKAKQERLYRLIRLFGGGR